MAFGYSQSGVVGLFAGAEVHQHGVTAGVLDKFLEHAQEKSISSSIVVQLCGAEDRGANYSIGIVASSTKNLEFVQEAFKMWAEAAAPFPTPCLLGTPTAPFTLHGTGAQPRLTEANRQGISGDDFTKANSKTGLCSILAEGQHVCCSQGKLPDLRPKEGADSYCAVYTTKKDD
ncbi:hypothetical protein EsH8_XI_000015 [Colletotrichum jinshuiense]